MPAQIRKKIAGLVYPGRSETLDVLGLIAEVSENHVTINLPSPAIRREDELPELIRSVTGPEFKVVIRKEQIATPRGLSSSLLANAKNIIAVASGKGGVGKSTIACNIGAALAQLGCSVGVMDADVYGPSQPHLLGQADHVLKIKDKQIQPAVAHGMKMMSMGFLMKPGQAVIWRGPMLHGMMNQFCKDVEWGELDFMIIDLPPGTGDISLSLSQIVDITASVIVTTPQDLALDVATKAVEMFHKLSVPILGLVENMSFYCCPQCGHRDDIFDHGGALKASERLSLPVLGEIPLNSALRQAGDAGVPAVLYAPDSAPAKALFNLASTIAERVSLEARLQETGSGSFSPA